MNNQPNQIVVWDPKSEFWEGALVDAQQEPKLRARGAVLLPCEPELFKRGGNSGFAKRAWGSGFPLSPTILKLQCPITLLCFRDPAGTGHTVHWAARLVSDAQYDARTKDSAFRPGGTVRFVGDSSRMGTSHVQVSPLSPAIDTRELGAKDAHDGWTVRGKVGITLPHDGHFGFAFYGAAEGLSVVWLAATIVKGEP